MTKEHKRSFVMPDDGKSSCCGLLAHSNTFNSHQSCPGCGKELYYLGKHPNDSVLFVDLEAIFLNDNEYGRRVRQMKYMSRYFQSKTHGKIVRFNIMESFTYNWETGRLYKVTIKNRSNKSVRDITYVCASSFLKPEFLKKVVQMRAFYLLPEVDIIRDIEQSLGVADLFQYIDMLYKESMDMGGSVDTDTKVRHILYCLAYPKFTWMSCPIHAAPTPKFRKALKEGKSQKELYGAFFNGNVGKLTIQFLNDPLLGKSEYGWSSVRFMSMFLNKDKVWALINSGWVIHLIETNSMWYDHEMDKDLTPKLVSGFTKDYGVDRFINHVADSGLGAQSIRGIIKDSIIMWRDIKKEMPEWTLNRASTLRGTHDNLTRDVRKLSVKNEEIEYTHSEKYLNSKCCDLEFILPKDVHSIIDVGDQLDICVGGGGYTKSAVSKDIIILFGYMDDAPMVCLEIKNGKLMQAKMARNAQAYEDADVSGSIALLCDENRIDHSECYDMIKPAEYGGPRPARAIVDNDDPFGLNF